MPDKKKEYDDPRDFNFVTLHIEADAKKALEDALHEFQESAPGIGFKGCTKSDFVKLLVKLQTRRYKSRFILVGNRGKQGTVLFDTQNWQAVTIYRDQGHIVCYPPDRESELYKQQAKKFNKEMFTKR